MGVISNLALQHGTHTSHLQSHNTLRSPDDCYTTKIYTKTLRCTKGKQQVTKLSQWKNICS